MMRRSKNIRDEMRKMQRNMDSLFRDFLGGSPFTEDEFLLEDNSAKSGDVVSSNFVEPVSDIYETDKDVVAEVDMPGVDKKDIKVNVTENGIEVKAEKKTEVKEEDKKKGMYRLERGYSGFCRSFALPENVDADKAEAEYKDGVLKIKVPKLKVDHKKKKLLDVK